jgi:hypothetical protein
VGLCGFFVGIFRLSLDSWGCFVAGWKGIPNNDKYELWAAPNVVWTQPCGKYTNGCASGF